MNILSYLLGRQSVNGGVTPHGTKNITDTTVTDVKNYANAQVVDEDLIASNIKKDVDILGVVGTFEGSGGGINFTANSSSEITSITTQGITKIPNSMFIDKKYLTSVNLNNEISFIGSESFKGCIRLTNITLPSSLSYIDTQTFRECTRLSSVIFNPNINIIGTAAFAGCTQLAITALPTSLGHINREAFTGCTSLALQSLDMAANGAFIQKWAFNGCTSLGNSGKFKIYGNNNLNIGDDAANAESFNGCTGLQKVWISNAGNIYSGAIGSTILPFRNCTNLTDIYTPLTEKPSNWGNAFNYINESTAATVHYGVSEAEFDAL